MTYKQRTIQGNAVGVITHDCCYFMSMTRVSSDISRGKKLMVTKFGKITPKCYIFDLYMFCFVSLNLLSTREYQS